MDISYNTVAEVNRGQYTPKRWRRMIETLIPDADNDDLIDYNNRQRSAWYTINIECSNLMRDDPDSGPRPVRGIRSGIVSSHLRRTPMLPVVYMKQTEVFSDLLLGNRRIVVWYPTPEQYSDYGRIPPGRT